MFSTDNFILQYTNSYEDGRSQFNDHRGGLRDDIKNGCVGGRVIIQFVRCFDF